jgi:hypothetical protein
MPPLPKSDKLAKEILNTESLPDHAEFVECLIREFDGPAGVAKKIRVSFDGAPKPIQQTILRFVMKQIEAVSERGLTNQDVDTASEEDLKRMIRDIMLGKDLNVTVAEEV